MHASNQIRHLPPSTVKHRNRWNHYPSQKPCQLHFQHLACPHFLPTKIVFLTNWRTTNDHGQLLSFSSHASNFWICKVFGLWSFPPGKVLLNCAAFIHIPGEKFRHFRQHGMDAFFYGLWFTSKRLFDLSRALQCFAMVSVSIFAVQGRTQLNGAFRTYHKHNS